MADEDELDFTNTIRAGGEVLLGQRYRVLEEIGRGGMGVVYRAEDLTLDGRVCALKMLPALLASDARAIKTLKKEALVAMELSHPHIVTLRSFEETAEASFLVMDYVDGRNLSEMLAERDTLPEEEALALLGPVAEALDYAHERGVVHRDLKPANILVAKDGTPFITDFGIAREMRDSLTRMTGVLTSGTLPYMSPEQLLGEPPTPAQDIYSLAATAWECLAGRPPFATGDIQYQIVHQAPKLPVDLETPLGRSLLTGLSKEPEERPPTSVELFQLADPEPAPPAEVAESEVVEVRVAPPHRAADRQPMPERYGGLQRSAVILGIAEVLLFPAYSLLALLTAAVFLLMLRRHATERLAALGPGANFTPVRFPVRLLLLGLAFLSIAGLFGLFVCQSVEIRTRDRLWRLLSCETAVWEPQVRVRHRKTGEEQDLRPEERWGHSLAFFDDTEIRDDYEFRTYWGNYRTVVFEDVKREQIGWGITLHVLLWSGVLVLMLIPWCSFQRALRRHRREEIVAVAASSRDASWWDQQLARGGDGWRGPGLIARNLLLILLWPVVYPFVQLAQLRRHFEWEREEGIAGDEASG